MQRFLIRMLLVALPAAFGCSTGSDGSQQVPSNPLFAQNGGDCSGHNVNVTVSVDEAKAPPPLQLRIESCRVDEDACLDMCSYELSNLPAVVAIFGATYQPEFGGDDPVDEGGGVGLLEPPDTSGITPSACKVTFDGGNASADIGFQTFGNNNGCAEPGEATNGGSGGGGGTTPVGGP